MLLAIDTSTRYAGVALASETRILQAAHWRSRQNHSVELLPTIESLLQRESTSVEELTGVAVAIGPGGFSALRVGISVAKGIAWTSALPLVAATTLEMEAFPYLTAGLPVCAVLDAGRGQVSWALFEAHGDGIAQTSQEAIAAPQEVLQSLHRPVYYLRRSVGDAPGGVHLRHAVTRQTGASLSAWAEIAFSRPSWPVQASGRADRGRPLRPAALSEASHNHRAAALAATSAVDAFTSSR